MSILIKGMEMPTNCMDCPFKGFDRAKGRGNICTINDSITLHAVLDGIDIKFVRMGDCPLIPVPPHGRLTKRIVYRGEVYNALEAERVNSLDGILTDPYKEGFHDGLKRALQILANEVEDAPTIIPAEDGE